MDLQEFVAQTLTQIVAGVHDATRRIAELGTNARVNPNTIKQRDDPAGRTSDVQFDVAITVIDQENDSKRDRVGAAAGILSVVSARISGESSNERSEYARNETVSRVRFNVQLAQPSEIDDRSEEERRKQAEDNAKIAAAGRSIGSAWAR